MSAIALSEVEAVASDPRSSTPVQQHGHVQSVRQLQMPISSQLLTVPLSQSSPESRTPFPQVGAEEVDEEEQVSGQAAQPLTEETEEAEEELSVGWHPN